MTPNDGKTPEEKAREKIDKQLNDAGWDIVARDEYIPGYALAVKEALMKGNTESDYLLFIDDKAVAVIEAKKEDNPLADDVEKQVENYAVNPQDWYGLWFDGLIPLVYLANGNKIYFKNMLVPDSEYEEISEIHSPKQMLRIIGKKSEFGALPRLETKGLRECQINAETMLEKSVRKGQKKNLAILATGSGKTYLACLASYRLLNYTPVNRILFLVDRNNLAKQTESEFSLFDRTEKQQKLGSLYTINRLRKESDVNGDIVISTIQKLFAVLTGQAISDNNEDEEDERLSSHDNETDEPVVLGSDLKLKPNHFQFIIVDECHRSIYGKWRAVLDYFSQATILGLTATPTPETDAFFNKNIVENYTYEQSVVDGVNVPSRVYRITTKVTEHGGSIAGGTVVSEKSKRTGKTEHFTANNQIEYGSGLLDRSVTNHEQIRTVLQAYKDAIYSELYPDRKQQWEYIPKTLIFAKDDNHATEIVEVAREVFGTAFAGGDVPEHFVQKITYSSGDSNALIRDLRTEKDFRIAVTVTLVATGTDVKPLEVVLFMKDVRSDVLYTQMKGRGCRSILDDKLKEVTPNADTKECYYLVDAVGVTENEKYIPKPFSGGEGGEKKLSLELLLEHLSHKEVSDENLMLLSNYCATIHSRYENNPLFGRHLTAFTANYGFSPRNIASDIQNAFDKGLLSANPYTDPSQPNVMRMNLIDRLISNIRARKHLLELKKGYIITSDDNDVLVYAGFSKESAKQYIDNFEKFLEDNKDSIEALRIIYNSEDTVITYKMLEELHDRLRMEIRSFGIETAWKSYKLLDTVGSVEAPDMKTNVKALTNLIQLVRYAFKKSPKLVSMFTGYTQRFTLFCGQAQRSLTDDQKDIMKQIADYIINDGAINVAELNEIDTDLWRKAVKSFGVPALQSEMLTLSKFLLKVA